MVSLHPSKAPPPVPSLQILGFSNPADAVARDERALHSHTGPVHMPAFQGWGTDCQPAAYHVTA